MDGERPEWLPVDWKVCVRVRSSGKKDKYYVNPSNDLKFNSKPEVLRYLKNAEKDLNELNKVDMKKSVTERLLPSGWIKDIRTTRKGGKTRRDVFYIDPVSGRCYCSMQEVKRYLETLNLECNEDGPDHPSEELVYHGKSATGEGEAERWKLIDEKVDKTLSGNESLKSEGSIDPPETDASGQIEKENDSVAEDEEKAAFPKKRKKNSKQMNGLPRRTSKRLARVEADPPLDVDTIGKSKLSGRTEVNSSENLNKQKEASTDLPLADLSSAEEHECDDKKLKSSLNDIFMDPCIEFAIKTLTGAIPLEDVYKMNKASHVQASASSSTLPFGDIWADPCFEFAVKTLTSEIPLDDGSHFQIALQQPLSSSGTSAK